MLSAFLAIIDRLIALLKQRGEERRSVFANHLDPLFIDLAAVHHDYEQAALEIWRVLEDSSVSDIEVLRRLQARRVDLAGLRVKVQALTAVYMEAHEHSSAPSEFRDFVSACIDYFSIGGGDSVYDHHIPDATYFTSMIALLELLSNDPTFTRAACAMEAFKLKQSIASQWSDLTLAYARAKAGLLPGLGRI